MNRILHTARTLVVTAALAVAGFAGVATLTTTAADAATGATFCFKWDTGAPYANQPVQLYSWYSGVKLRDGYTNSAGCGVWTGLTSTGQYRVRSSVSLVTPYGTKMYDGWSPSVTGSGAGTVNLGLGVAYYQGCLANQYGPCR